MPESSPASQAAQKELQAAPTQPWDGQQRLDAAAYTVERVTFDSAGVSVVGNLFVPKRPNGGAIAILGPVAFVKEQSPVQYATRLVRDGFFALAFDPRHHGESGGEPRRLESGRAKQDDLQAALGFLQRRTGVSPDKLLLVGICQGVNWTAAAAVAEPRVRAVALVAGHYLGPETARLYVGSDDRVAERVARARQAREAFESTGMVTYIPIVGGERALLQAAPVRQFYERWSDRGPMWAFHGLWENRITALSEVEIWSHDVTATLERLKTPTLMIHADRAASGAVVPRALFQKIAASDKQLVWLGGQGQLQFYEDPITIDRSAAEISRFFGDQITKARQLSNSSNEAR